MTVRHAVRATVPLVSLAGASAFAAAIVVLAPEVGREVLLALIGGWTVLAAVRIVILVGYTRRFYQRLEAAHAARAQ
jgi:hypothetical protein